MGRRPPRSKRTDTLFPSTTLCRSDVSTNGRVVVRTAGGQDLTADAVVLATGAWLPDLAEHWIRVPIRAGRGYSFTVPLDRAMPGPIYLPTRSEEHTSELQSLMRISYAVFCLKKKTTTNNNTP